MRKLGKRGFIPIVFAIVLLLGLASITTYTIISDDSVDVITGHAVGPDEIQQITEPSTSNSKSSDSKDSINNDLEPSKWGEANAVTQEEKNLREETTPTVTTYTTRRSSGSSSSSSSSSSTTNTVSVSGAGTIQFSSSVSQSVIDSDITVSYNFISVNSGSSAANVPATLTFTNLPYTSTPLILRNGQVCNDCSNVNYNSGTLSVHVDHFSNYTTAGNYPACTNSLLTSVSQSLNTSASVNLTFFNFDATNNDLTLYSPEGTSANVDTYSNISAPSQHKFEITTYASGNQTYFISLEPFNCTLNYTLEIDNNDTIAPSTISNLTRSNSTNTSFTLSWANPSDADFSHAQVYVDTQLVANVTGNTLTVSKINGLDLEKGVPHNISITTVDLNGNKNETSIDLLDVRPYFDCLTDLQCDDGNAATIDFCSTQSYDGLVCMHQPINIWGQIIDEFGTPLVGKEISLFDASTFIIGVNETTGTFDEINPRSNPDFVTDSNGNYFGFADPTKTLHMAINGSIKRDYNIEVQKKKNKNKNDDNNNSDTHPETPTNFPIILPEDGDLNILFESASAGLKSDLWIETPIQSLIVNNSRTGVSANFTGLNEGDEIVLSAFVHADAWGLPNYKHYSNDTTYAIVDRVDYNTWRVRFEDLDSQYSTPDFDYNDIVALIGLDTVINESFNETYEDCDSDGYLNWQDNDDDACDLGEHDSEVDENSTQWSTKYNVAGHIIYSGQFENENQYACGDQVRFTMFGRNKGNQDLNITYYVESHVNGGQPEDAGTPCVESGDIMYCGDDTISSQTLELPDDGEKYTEYFDFTVPCNYPAGKYDIHVQHNPKWGNMHKIGNFFVVDDTTAPWINANTGETDPFYISTYTNISTTDIFYIAEDVAQSGTLRENSYQLAVNKGSTLAVSIDKDILTDGPDADLDPTNDNDLLMSEGNSFFNLTYNESGHYTARLTAIDAANNTATLNISVDVFITEDEAKTLYRQAIDTKWLNKFGMTYLETGGAADASDFKEDYLYYDSKCEEINVDFFFNDDQLTTFTHMEYLTELNTDLNPTYYTNITTNSSRIDEPVGGVNEYFTDQCLTQWNSVIWDNVSTPQHYILALSEKTESEFISDVTSYLDHVWCKETIGNPNPDNRWC